MRGISARVGSAGIAFLALAAVAIAPVAAQDVTYTTTSKVELGSGGGAMGLLSRVAGGGATTLETVHIKGRQMRTDTENQSVIHDLDSRRIIFLNHNAETYTILNFDDLQEAMERGVAAIQEELAEARVEQEAEPSNLEVDFDFSVRRTGERQVIHGSNAERVFLTLGMSVTGEGAESEDEDVELNTVILTEMWQSTDFPAYGYKQELGEAYMDMAAPAAGLSQIIQQALASDPGMAAGMEQSFEEARQLEGETLRSTMYLVTVPPGVAFDADLVLGKREAAEERPARRGLRGLARAAARAAGAEGDDEESDEAEPRQATLFSVTTEVTDVMRDAVPASLFEIPANYRMVELEGLDTES